MVSRKLQNTKNISENQNLYYEMNMIVAEQNRTINELQLQIAKQNEKENEYKNCEKKLQQAEEYIASLMNKHNQIVNELNQQILNLKNNYENQIQQILNENKNKNETSNRNQTSSQSFSLGPSLPYSASREEKTLPKQKTAPILASRSNSSNSPSVQRRNSADSVNSKKNSISITINF